MSAPVVELTGVSKRFDATQALDDVSLTLYPGETHAPLGENGAGKSTLIKVMTGIHAPDAGVIRVHGEETSFKGSGEAQKAGIAAIYQEPAIFPDLNVAENIFISHQDRGAIVRWRRMYRDAEAILARIDVRMDVRTLASGLTVASQQAVEIAKALSLEVRVLIMDEPTAALSAHEVSEPFEQIRRLTDSGVAVLFISHRLDEVFEIADRVTVLRDGRLISSRPKAEVTQGQAIREMVGRDMADFVGIAAAGKAMTDEGLCDKVKVSGLGLPEEMKEYTLSGCAPKFALWSFKDLGYLAFYAAYGIGTGQIKAEEGAQFEAGRLGDYTIEKDPTRDNGLRVLMGPFTVYDKSNVEEG